MRRSGAVRAALAVVASLGLLAPWARAADAPAAAPVAVPKALERQLKNQMRILILEDHREPVVHFRFVVRAGAADEPREKAGVANLTMRTLQRGVGTLDAKAVEEKLDDLDLEVGVQATRDFGALTAELPAKDWLEGLRVLAGIVRDPTFPAAEVERARGEVLASIAGSRGDVATLAAEHVAALVYGEHPYASPVAGDSSTLARITRDDLARFHATYFKSNLCVLVVAGDVVPDHVVAGVELLFADWGKANAPARAKPALPAFETNRVRLLDWSGGGSTELRLAIPGVSRRSADHDALLVLNTILGGDGFPASRLAALDAGARSASDEGQDTGALVVAATAPNAEVGATLERVLATVEELRAKGPTKQEVEDARRFLLAGLPRQVATLGDLAAQWAAIDLYDLGADHFERFAARLDAVTPAVAKAAAEKYLRGDRFALVAVGPAATVKAPLEKFGAVEVLDPRSPTGAIPSSRPVLALPPEAFGPEAVSKAGPIVARALEAHGGAARLLAVKDLTLRSTVAVTTPTGSLDGQMRVVLKLPDRTRIEMAMLGQNGVQVLNGEQAWASTGAQVSELSVEQKQAMQAGIRTQVLPFLQRLAAGDRPVAWVEGGIVGEDSVDVLQVLEDGALVRASFSRGSGLLVKVEQEEPALFGGGRLPTARLYSDFRTVDGLTVPFRTERLVRGTRAIEDRLSSLEVNKGVADSQFQRPAR